MDGNDMGDLCDHHHLSVGDGRSRSLLYEKKAAQRGNYYLGGRKLGPIVTAMSAEASDMSSWLLMGLPGVAYLTGVADAAWTAIGLAIGTYLNWLIVAKKTASVYCGSRKFDHDTGVFFQPLSR